MKCTGKCGSESQDGHISPGAESSIRKGCRRKKSSPMRLEIFSTIEINGTFYSMQRPSSFEKWTRETPDDFDFAIKGSRFITHMRKLRNVELLLANFFASGILKLGKKL